jgi:hypothetical protein
MEKLEPKEKRKKGLCRYIIRPNVIHAPETRTDTKTKN